MATIDHCLFCFETLDAELSSRTPLSLAAIQTSYAEYKGSPSETDTGTKTKTDTDTETETETATDAKQLGPSPLFVTWNTDEDGDEPGEYNLRGCIGTFEAQPLERGLSTYALTAALDDTRFRPIAKRELPRLQVAVTLLTDFEPARDALDWELGKHGLRISFGSGSGRQQYGATYLPDVAPEQGWTKEETVDSLMRKAGWQNPAGRSRGAASQPWTQVASFKTVRYQGAKTSLPYAEYKAWRDWADKK
ncbi:ammecr1 family protein [Ophiostoma piceae UAMH 11346]|uniref:Ammecr1 family protein n=1 Tax=Ophiostoma piceae (strain UAMH 11346) TaxID=1262450 RepID=S3CWQ7_OPHP1|nr:ammecr1 family protein [Ophiostoma piceae UAMH 11346]